MAADITYGPKVYNQQGGDRLVVASGGEIDIEAGGALKIAGTTIMVARGTVTPTSASHTVATGLATVVAAVAVSRDAVTLTHMFTQADIGDQAGTPAAGSILIVSQKPTATGDVTPIASTTPWTAVDWVAVGT
jgi:hypothetical protein